MKIYCCLLLIVLLPLTQAGELSRSELEKQAMKERAYADPLALNSQTAMGLLLEIEFQARIRDEQEESQRWFRISAANGSPQGLAYVQNITSALCLKIKTRRFDYQSAIVDLFLKMSSNPSGDYSNECNEIVGALERAAEVDGHAGLALATLYSSDHIRIVKKDRERARGHLDHAIKKLEEFAIDLPEVNVVLGDLFSDGFLDLGRQDKEEAYRFYERGASAGVKIAKVRLADRPKR